jgi:hypothetical protein
MALIIDNSIISVFFLNLAKLINNSKKFGGYFLKIYVLLAFFNTNILDIAGFYQCIC